MEEIYMLLFMNWNNMTLGYYDNGEDYDRKLRKRDESAVSPVVNGDATQVVTTEPSSPAAFRQQPTSVSWVFPPLPPQPNLYHHNVLSQDALVPQKGFRGLKRQLSGRFKRLISRKRPEPEPTIPPELKPQLKTIYVY